MVAAGSRLQPKCGAMARKAGTAVTWSPTHTELRQLPNVLVGALSQWLVATYLDTRGIPHETIRFRHDDVQQLIRKIGLKANPPKATTQQPHQTLRGYAA